MVPMHKAQDPHFVERVRASFARQPAMALIGASMPVVEAGEISDRAEIGTGDEADVDFMQSAVGLVWRALMLWLLLLLLLGFASMVGP